MDRKEQIQRIGYYEELLCRAENILKTDVIPEGELSGLSDIITELDDYYGSSTWKKDLADDEAGLIPNDVRRGVLSEDGIYNVLEQYAQTVRSMITKKLFSLQDKKYGQFQAKLMPGMDAEKIIGVRTPDIRNLAKKLRKENAAKAFLTELPHKYFDEDQLHAMIISEEKSFDICTNQLEMFLPFVDNWATCDQLLPKAFKAHEKELLPYIRRWIASDKTYTIRFGMGMLMRHFLDEYFDPEYPELVAEVSSDEYYINMMRAWYFATAMAKQYKAIIPYIEENRLDIWTHNKTIQKCVESFRISPQQKEYLKTLKRKADK